MRAVFLLLAGLAAASAPAADVTVTATAAKTDVTVGETFAVEVQAQGPEGTTWTFPAEIAEDTVELRARADARPQPGRQAYDAQVFALKDASVPAIRVSYRLPDGTEGSAETEPITLEVGSLLPRDPQEHQLSDIRPPVPLSIGTAFYVALGALLLVLAAVAFWLWRRGRAPEAARPARPAVPADVAALAALDRLAAAGHLAREEYRPFYIELTEIVKRYLEARLGAPVLEMTTAEMLAFLRKDGRTAAMADVMRTIASSADQIKFARGQGVRDAAERHLGEARKLVTDLESRLRPVATPVSAGHDR
jgi:hypothetical protein